MSRAEIASRNKGAALVITLLVIISLAGLAVGFSQESGVECDLASFTRDGDRAYHLARSGLSMVCSAIQTDKDRQADTLRQPWADANAIRLPEDLEEGTELFQTVADESGKLNLNALIDGNGVVNLQREAQIRKLLVLLGMEESKVDALLDWLDADTQERSNGAEDLYYQTLDPPYDCANGPFLSMRQLTLVKGWREIPAELRGVLTIYSDGRINLNTASREVLECLSPRMDRSLAEAIIDYRRNRDFLSVEDLGKIPVMDPGIMEELAPLLTVRSSAFSIIVRAGVHGAEAGIETVVSWQQGNLKTLYWRII